MRNFFKITVASFLIFFASWMLVFLCGINKLAIQSEDTLPADFLPLVILKDHTLYLDRYYQMLITRYPHPDDKSYVKGLTPCYLKKVGHHYLSAFPIITPILALTLYLPFLFGLPDTWNNVIFFSHLASALIVALSGGFLYLLIKRNSNLSEKNLYLLVFIFLFGTVNYAMTSQSLWQHGALQLLMILSLYYWFELMKNPGAKSSLLYGLFSGLAILSRPTALLPVGLMTLYLGIVWIRSQKNWKTFIFLILAGVSIGLFFFLWYNSKYYLSINNQGYTGQLAGSWLSPFPISFFGVWVSPSKGILTYSPIFLFSLIGLYLAWKSKKQMFLLFGLIVILHTLVISLWKHWYGGWSFGYRMSSDIIPFLILLIIPFMESRWYKKLLGLFYVLLIWSISMELFGMVFFDGIWHAAYDRGFTDTSWLWSIKDSEIAFNVRRVLVKLGLLARACPKCL